VNLPDAIAAGQRELAGATGAHERMMTTAMVFRPAARLPSFELVADITGLAMRRAA
jgi:hypothetical protein